MSSRTHYLGETQRSPYPPGTRTAAAASTLMAPICILFVYLLIRFEGGALLLVVSVFVALVMLACLIASWTAILRRKPR